MNTITLQRYRGAMLGVLAGDSIAARLENKTAAFIKNDLVKYDGKLLMMDYIEPWKGVRHINAGQPTDDSELTAALGLTLAYSPEFNADAIYLRLRNFIFGNSPEGRKSVLTNGDAYGSGGTLRAALRPATYQESIAGFSRGEIPLLPTNGSLMRVTPISLRYHGDLVSLTKYARWQSCITHMHPSAQAACIAHSVLMSYVLSGADVPSAWELTKHALSQGEYRKIPELQEMLSMDVSEPDDSVIWPHTGSVSVSLRVALWASLTATDFRDGITKATIVGGDTDTYAAIAGGILGARFFESGIPAEWRNALQGGEIMTTIAEKLYALVQS